jgi:predicted glutamine amidotransferase
LCRFFGLRATAPTSIDCCLVRARNSLMAQSRRDLQGFDHADGWGIAAWHGHDLLIQREANAAHLDDDFRAAASRVEAPTVVAHVRRATVGAIQPVNTHPFSHGPWAFVHNGTVPYFEQIRERMLAGMTPLHRSAIRGETDSEHLFHLILSRHEQDAGRPVLDSLAASLVQVLRWCREIGDYPRLGLNVLLTDGARMVGSRWQRTLCFLERNGRQPCPECGRVHACGDPAGYRALVIASEPTTTGEPWQEVLERSAFEVGDDLGLRFEPLDP